MLAKSKKLLALLLGLAILAGLLAACGGTKGGILSDVKDAYELDEAAEKQIGEMFSAFDSAFETLVNCKPVKYVDFKNYGDAICKAEEATKDMLSGKSDRLNEKMETADQKTKDTYATISLNYLDIVLAQPNSYFEDYETYAEDAIALVNAYSKLFYGTERITEKDKDRIDFDSEANKTLLPFCLQFGNSYDECAQLHDMPELAPASGNAGYFCSGDYSVMMKGFFNGFSWADDISPLMPSAEYSFNEDHLLYEYYYITKFESENEAERAFNSLTDWLSEELGTTPNVTESDKLAADFTTAELGSRITLEQLDDGTFRLFVVLHSIPNELKSLKRIDRSTMIDESEGPVAAEPSRSAQVEIGDYITFGSYEQDNNTANGKEPIEWLVLDRQGDSAFVVSRYALDCQLYHPTMTNVTWGSCALRSWLNDTFYYSAFSADEQRMIQNAAAHTSWDDQVFLLSASEVNTYFPSDSAMTCRGTAYCYAQGAYIGTNDNCWWWLRSAGSRTATAVNVSSNGGIHYDGNDVDACAGAVRPAMWITVG